MNSLPTTDLRLPTSSLARTALLVAALLAAVPLGAAAEPAVTPAQPALQATPPTAQPEAGPAPGKPTERQREGTKLVDQIGTFEFFSGDRATFVPVGSKESYRVLENLALERIGRQPGDGRTPQQWLISGTLTEFKGANYLLVTKAVARAAPKSASQ